MNEEENVIKVILFLLGIAAVIAAFEIAILCYGKELSPTIEYLLWKSQQGR